MSKVNQIQQALLTLSGGTFQKLADVYLAEKGYDRLNSIGSVTGADKVKAGTPDTLVALPNGNYVFVEHTTQQGGLFSKMDEDLDKCFDEEKTGVPTSKIDRVIFCFTSSLDAEQQHRLAERCQEQGVGLDLFGIDAISFDLYRHYPGLARDFLGVEIDTGQIVQPDQFVALYNNNKLATRLDLGFHFREDELEGVFGELESQNLVIVSGSAGVGKSRLALEACKRFEQAHPDYQVMCVFGRNRDLWKDLQSRFRKPGHFLILVDDANRVSQFEYIVDLLLHQRMGQEIKVIATVRDYALPTVKKDALRLGSSSEITLAPFTDEEIKELVKEEYGIRNYHYLERIADVAQGNPRLAVMAAEVAKGGPLHTIHDVSALYDRYFHSIRQDLQAEGVDLQSSDLLKVAAIVSFFKAVDRTNEEQMEAIEHAFNISDAVLWEGAHQLHDMEVLDLYEDEVVKISDQVLGTYLFYVAVFEEEALDFGALLSHFFPRLRHRLVDSINPVLSAFDSRQIVEAMRPHVDSTWSRLEEVGDSKRFRQLVDVFWFVKRTDTLLWVWDRIAELEPEAAHSEDIDFEKSTNAVPSASLLSVLRHFAHAEMDEVRMALDLIIRYLAKRPTETPLVLRLLIEDYGFRHTSWRRRFSVQRAVIDVLSERVRDGNPVFARIFLAVASDYVGTHFENTGMKREGVFNIRRFDLPATPALIALREVIWSRLFALFEYEYLRNDVLGVIHDYSTSPLRVSVSDVVKQDAEHVLPFLTSVLEPDRYEDCVVYHDYINCLEDHDVEVPNDQRDQFRSDVYAVSELLISEWDSKRAQNLSYSEFEQQQRDRLVAFTEGFTFEDYQRLLSQCLEIRGGVKQGHLEHRLRVGVVDILVALARQDFDLYEDVLKHYLGLGDPLDVNGHSLVRRLVEQRDAHEALQLLSEMDFPGKERWLFYVHEVVPEQQVDRELLSHLYTLYAAADPANLPQGMDFLLKYCPKDERVFAKVVEHLLRKSEEGYPWAIEMLFNPHTDVAKRLGDLFSDDIELLKEAYLALEAIGRSSDYQGATFDLLLDLDPAFMPQYIDWKFKTAENEWLSSHSDTRDYTFIWQRNDYQEVMERAAEAIYQRQQYSWVDPYLNVFFRNKRGGKEDEDVLEAQNAFLVRMIEERHEDVDFMKFLFAVIGEFTPERRCYFVEHFVQHNTHFEAFQALSLEPKMRSTSGSWVPVLQKQVGFWESLRSIMNAVDLLPHKQYIERRIQSLRDEIEREKKKDFIGY